MGFVSSARVLAAALLGVLLAVGCAAPSRTGRTLTPQESVHCDQLAEMGREDGKAAGASTRKTEVRRPPSSPRRAGQGVVDQPIRP